MTILSPGRKLLAILGVAVAHFVLSVLSFFCMLGMAFSAASSEPHTPNLGDVLGTLYWTLGFPGCVVINWADGADPSHGLLLAIVFLNSLLWSVVLVTLWRWSARFKKRRRNSGVL